MPTEPILVDVDFRRMRGRATDEARAGMIVRGLSNRLKYTHSTKRLHWFEINGVCVGVPRRYFPAKKKGPFTLKDAGHAD